MTQTAVVQFSNDQLALVKNTVAKGTTNEQFKLFIEVCKYHNLNPFARQIYAVVRGGNMVIQTSIDGYRLLAERSGKYAGQLGPEWCGDDGMWKDVWLSDKPPVAARIGVLRKDFAQPTWGVAKYKSYVQESSPLWKKMPDVMLAKCSESLALRKAFPAEMSGIYTAEEMQQADSHELPSMAPLNGNTTVEAAPPAPDEPAEQRQQQTTTKRRQFTPISATPKSDSQQQQSDQAQAVATAQQIASIQKLCQHVSMSVPDDLDSMSFFGAKALIEQLTTEYKTQRADAQQAASTAAPASGQSKALLDMIAKSKQSVEELGVLWDDAKTDAGVRQVKDEGLTVQQVVAINKLVPQYKQRQTAKAS